MLDNTPVIDLADKISELLHEVPCDDCLSAIVCVMASTMDQMSHGTFDQSLLDATSEFVTEAYKWYTSAEAAKVTAKINLN